MKIDFKKIFDSDNQTVPLECSLDMSQTLQWGVTPFALPVQIKGNLENRAGIVTLRYTATLNYQVLCDRCLIPIERNDEHLSFEHIIVRSLNGEDNDEYVVVADGVLNFDDLAISDIILELPIKNICSKGCKGLCPNCGTNLNEESCNCKAPADPRWSKLDSLFET